MVFGGGGGGGKNLNTPSEALRFSALDLFSRFNFRSKFAEIFTIEILQKIFFGNHIPR